MAAALSQGYASRLTFKRKVRIVLEISPFTDFPVDSLQDPPPQRFIQRAFLSKLSRNQAGTREV
jgi:hypothetical protein